MIDRTGYGSALWSGLVWLLMHSLILSKDDHFLDREHRSWMHGSLCMAV